jgi:hypothetical protein
MTVSGAGIGTGSLSVLTATRRPGVKGKGHNIGTTGTAHSHAQAASAHVQADSEAATLPVPELDWIPELRSNQIETACTGQGPLEVQGGGPGQTRANGDHGGPSTGYVSLSGPPVEMAGPVMADPVMPAAHTTSSAGTGTGTDAPHPSTMWTSRESMGGVCAVWQVSCPVFPVPTTCCIVVILTPSPPPRLSASESEMSPHAL